MHQTSLYSIREAISSRVGSPVELVCRSRRKEHVHQGVLEGAYKSLFTVCVTIDGTEQRLSYMYSDVLTNCVTVKPL